MSIPKSLRRAAAVACGVAAITTGATVASAAVATASAEAATWLRVTCQSVYMRDAPAGNPYTHLNLTYGTTVEWISWPSTPGWVQVRWGGAVAYVDANCMALA